MLHQSIIAQNGDYVETRLLNAGARTNPWFQETLENLIGENELTAPDTDVVGCHGYYADFPDAGYDGEIRPGMTLCVESYIGEEGGKEGVKLEQQVLITETGVELLSRFPFEDALLR